ncbi:MAG: hypothetical protein ABR589_01185 [Chthoniobacterales bacterium]
MRIPTTPRVNRERNDFGEFRPQIAAAAAIPYVEGNRVLRRQEVYIIRRRNGVAADEQFLQIIAILKPLILRNVAPEGLQRRGVVSDENRGVEI